MRESFLHYQNVHIRREVDNRLNNIYFLSWSKLRYFTEIIQRFFVKNFPLAILLQFQIENYIFVSTIRSTLIFNKYWGQKLKCLSKMTKWKRKKELAEYHFNNENWLHQISRFLFDVCNFNAQSVCDEFKRKKLIGTFSFYYYWFKISFHFKWIFTSRSLSNDVNNAMNLIDFFLYK